MTFPKNQAVSKRLLATTTALILMAVFAGCSSDNEEDPDNTVETSDAETEYVPASADGPAQNVPEPNLPAVATENTEEGAEATLKYFWEAIDYGRLTGKTNTIELVSQDHCDFCSGLIEGWHDAYKEGSWAALNGEMQVKDINAEPADDEASQEDVLSFSFELREPAADFYDEGQYLEEESFDTSSTADWWADLTFDGTAQRWKVDWIGLEEQKSKDAS